MKRHTTLTAALLTTAFLASACSGDDEEQDGPVGHTEVDIDGPQGTDAPEEEADEQDTETDEPASDDEEQESEEPPQSAEAAYQQAIEDSEELGAQEDYSDFEMDGQDFADGDEFQEFLAEREVVLERAAEVMTGFQAGDWNKDVAIVRASYLLIDGAQQGGIPERPQSGDPAWDTAMECGAEAEVRTESLGVNDDEDSHTPHSEIVAEYRWTDGDEDCELDQPDHYYRYMMTMNDDALVTDFSRDQVSYGDDEGPGLFDDED